eukprot:m51a1_g1475 hypothetical protein (514) ;mRNA; r:266698-268435
MASSRPAGAEERARWMLEISSEHRLRQENLAFDIDVWYPSLARYTFPTVFIPLTRPEAQAVVNYYSGRFLGRQGRLRAEDVAELRQLEGLVDREVCESFAETGAFLRLCGRSVKDAEPLDRQSVRDAYAAELERLLRSGAPAGANTKLRAVARVGWLRVRSGEEAMSLLLTSERAYADLRDWLEFGEPEQLVLRRWEPRLTYDLEFRAFVHRGALTAISQYDHYCVYPHLHALRERIEKVVVEFWREVHAHVGEDAYVMDVGVMPGAGEGGADRVVLIELSPFLECTGPALFSWKTDGEQLRNGPLQLRLRSDEYPQLDLLVECNWEDRWAQDVEHYRSFFAAAVGSAPLADQSKPAETHALFVYGTLKRGFHWNRKFLSRSRFVGEATTAERYPLVVGQCGVPYLLGDMAGEGKRVRGELWAVDGHTLAGLDEYEGVSKGHYCRRAIDVVVAGGGTATAQCYCNAISTAELRAREFVDEYTQRMHSEQYRAIRHILVKQQLYLGSPLTLASS